MYQKLSRALLLATAIGSQQVFSLGLGEMTMHSALNEPLDADIVLNSIDDLDAEQIKINMASLEQFQQSGVERTAFLSDIKFVVEIDKQKNTAVIKLSSNKRLKEPFLDFLLEAKWPTGRVLRSYTALVDLPVYAEVKPQAVNAPASNNQAPASQPETASQPQSSTTEQAATQAPAQQGIQQEEAAAPSSSEPSYASGGDYFTKRGDSLWEIASEYRTDRSVSVQQMMLAIQQANDHAFIGGNINRLKAGVQLSIPSVEQARDMSFDQAVSEVKRQNQQWREPQLDATADVDSERQLVDISGEVEEGHLSLTSAGSGESNGSDTSSEQTSGSGTANAAELEATQKQLANTTEQNKTLKSQVSELERMLEIKSSELAQLQQALADRQEAVETAEQKPELAAQEQAPQEQEQVVDTAQATDAQQQKAEAEGQAEETAATEQGDTSATEAAEAETSPEQAAQAEQAAAAQDVAADQAQEAVAKTQPAPPAPPVTTQQTAEPWWKSLLNPLYLGGVALFMMLVGALLIFRKKQQSEGEALAQLEEEFDVEQADEQEQDSQDAIDTEAIDALDEDSFAEADLDDADDLDAIEDLDVDEDDVEHETESTEVETDDAIGEADIYIAYGRYEQAAQLLKSAIASQPEDTALRNKLLEVYAQADEKENFQQEYVALSKLNDADAVNQAKEMLSSHDHATSWLDDLPATEAAEPVEDSLDGAGDGYDLSAEFDEPENDDSDDAFDLDGLDLDADDTDDQLLDIDSADDEVEELDLDADLGFDNVNAMEELEADLELDDSLAELDLDVEDEDSETGLSLGADLDDDLSLDDTDLDLGELDTLDIEDNSEAETEVSSLDDDLDLDGLDLNEDLNESTDELNLDTDIDTDLDDDLSVDLDLDELSLDVDGLDADELDVNLGADSLEAELDAPQAEASDVSSEDLSLDVDLDDDLSLDLGDELSLDMGGDLSVDLDASDLSAEESVKNSFSMDEIDLDSDFGEDVTEISGRGDQPAATQTALTALSGDDLEFLGDSDEVATKLDLAKAYIEMGDDDGAQDILQEVLAEGSAAQKSEAQSMLDGLS